MLAIAVPMTLAYLTTPLIGLVDTAVVGHLGDAALLGGLAAGAIIFDIVFATFNFLRSGTTGLVAQAFGRGDAIEEQAVLLRAIVVSLVIGIALALLAPLVSLAGAWFMGAEPRVLAAMDTYVRIRAARRALRALQLCGARLCARARRGQARPSPAARAQRRQHRAGDLPRPLSGLGRGRRRAGARCLARRPAWRSALR